LIPTELLVAVQTVRERNATGNPSFFQMLRDYESQPHAKSPHRSRKSRATC